MRVSDSPSSELINGVSSLVAVGPTPGVCPFVVTSSSSFDDGPLPLVVSPSLPAAVDLTVCHADDLLPLNLSVSSVDAGLTQFQAVSGQCESGQSDGQPPPPAHCHSVARPVLDSKLSVDALSRLHSSHVTTTAASNSAAGRSNCGDVPRSDDVLRSLDVLSAAAALRSEMLDQRRLPQPPVPDSVTPVNSCQVMRRSSVFWATAIWATKLTISNTDPNPNPKFCRLSPSRRIVQMTAHRCYIACIFISTSLWSRF